MIDRLFIIRKQFPANCCIHLRVVLCTVLQVAYCQHKSQWVAHAFPQQRLQLQFRHLHTIGCQQFPLPVPRSSRERLRVENLYQPGKLERN